MVDITFFFGFGYIFKVFSNKHAFKRTTKNFLKNRYYTNACENNKNYKKNSTQKYYD